MLPFTYLFNSFPCIYNADNQKELSLLLVHFPNAHNSQTWMKPISEYESYVWAFHISDRTPTTWNINCCFPWYALAAGWSRKWSWFSNLDNPIGDVGILIPNVSLTTAPSTHFLEPISSSSFLVIFFFFAKCSHPILL